VKNLFTIILLMAVSSAHAALKTVNDDKATLRKIQIKIAEDVANKVQKAIIASYTNNDHCNTIIDLDKLDKQVSHLFSGEATLVDVGGGGSAEGEDPGTAEGLSGSVTRGISFVGDDNLLASQPGNEDVAGISIALGIDVRIDIPHCSKTAATGVVRIYSGSILDTVVKRDFVISK
jgi:hypothetical protein